MIDEDQRRARARGDKMVGREAEYTSGGKSDSALASEVALLKKELAELRQLVTKGSNAAPAKSGH
jgi:hypothetical protein